MSNPDATRLAKPDKKVDNIWSREIVLKSPSLWVGIHWSQNRPASFQQL